MRRNIISVVKPTRCTNVSNLFYFGMTLYMFRTVFPSIIRSSKTVHTATGICQTETADCMQAISQLYAGVCLHTRPSSIENNK